MANLQKPYPRFGSKILTLGVGAELPPMTITGVDLNDPDGVVPLNYLLTPLKVQIPRWSPLQVAGDEDHILELRELSDDGEWLIERITIKPPPPAIPNEYEFEIPLAWLRRRPRRTAWLFYSVINGGNTTESQKTQILVDLERPSLLKSTDTVRFVVPPVPAVNEAYLTANPLVAFYIPLYNVMAKGDRIEFFLSNQPNAPLAAAAGGSLLNVSSLPWTATLAADAFRKLSNGNAYVRFRIYDATGNYSDLSADLPFVVGSAVVVQPVTLPAPRLESTLNRLGYLTCSSLTTEKKSVSWTILPNTNIQVGDQIKFIWQGYQTNNWETLLANVLFEQTATWTLLHQTTGMPVVMDAYYTALFPLRKFSSAIGRYEVWRGGAKLGDSLQRLLRVDLTFPTGGAVSGSKCNSQLMVSSLLLANS
ncbi:hypothetical protein B7453_27570 [Pseudomonas sp. IB20]|uniref:hypothetical protein n=1 Tax=Pseudomonas TaxID=286 RepID=UPI000BA174F0|nr:MULTISPECIES: hypothetical protein [unclassified Pseudomonas]MCV2229370.1 hypothetical protein [Pseudomonas sp. AU10]OZO01325.1 hypothetical protein B7453_27570 [Pseudomonas sp. IB20]